MTWWDEAYNAYMRQRKYRIEFLKCAIEHLYAALGYLHAYFAPYRPAILDDIRNIIDSVNSEFREVVEEREHEEKVRLAQLLEEVLRRANESEEED